MKKAILILIALFFIQIISASAQGKFEFSEADRTKRITEDINVLAHDSLRGREGGTEWEYRSANYIIKEFEEIGLVPIPGLDAFRQPFNIENRIHKKDSTITVQVESNNVLAYLDNGMPYTIVIGAHYDHLGFKFNEDSALIVYNGADDNASGSAAVLEMARYITQNESFHKYNYIFACWGSEEKGLLGSNHFCNSKIYPFEKIAFYVNFDMIGRLGWKKDQIDIFGMGSSTVWNGFLPEDKYEDYKLKKMAAAFDASDHACFHTNKTPFIYFTTGLPPQYHQPSDESDIINYKGVEEIIELCESIILKFDGEKPDFREFTDKEVSKVSLYFIGQFFN
jgi:hypothetical protein